MTGHPTKDLLHGITLEKLLAQLVDELGWNKMGLAVRIDCFIKEPSISSSLKFLRRTPWARKEVETLYLRHLKTKKHEPKD